MLLILMYLLDRNSVKSVKNVIKLGSSMMFAAACTLLSCIKLFSVEISEILAYL